jgi:Bacteriophage baseplate protein W
MDLNHETGGALSGWAAVEQSILTILSTRLETRIFLREFGSEVPALIDAPMNDAGRLSLIVAVSEALARWEPRFELTDVELQGAATGVVSMTLSGNHRPNAHLGDFDTLSDQSQAIRIQRAGLDNWSLGA